MDYVILAIPFFLLAILVEVVYGYAIKKNTYRLNDSISSLFMGSLRSTSRVLGISVGGYFFYWIEKEYGLWRWDSSSAFTWIFTFVVYDLLYYWFHRISHERQIFWASHVAHHQSEDYNLSTALRQTGTGFLITWVFYIPLFLIGIPSYIFISVASINLIYQFWVHTEHIPKLGWYELFFVTPSNHRVHHAQNNEYLDKNYGGVFIIWDRLFGTFQEEIRDKPCVYGIRSPINTFNPVVANLHIYIKIIKDIWHSQTWKDRLYVPVAKTGWSPGMPKEQSQQEEFNPSSFNKYNPKSNKVINSYAFIQLLAISTTGLLFLENGNLNYIESVTTLGMMIFTMYCVSQWLDSKPVMGLEIFRLIVLVLSVIYFYFFSVDQLFIISLLSYTFFNSVFLPFLRRADLIR